VTSPRLELTRAQILAHRLAVGALNERLPSGAKSLRRAAWAGLQDSMPRAALLSIHARVEGVEPSAWEDPSLAQVWGPRFGAYVVPAVDVGVFTLGRLPPDGPRRHYAEDLAERLDRFLEGRRMPYGQAGRGLGMHGNMLRYAALTGRLLIRWEGARQPLVWTVPPPAIGEAEARLELARRYLHIFGPTTPAAFEHWAGIRAPRGHAAFDELAGSLAPVRTPKGDEWILADDEARFRSSPAPGAGVRLLPSGDAFYLLHGADRELLVPDAAHRPELWTPRVWPGAVLLGGEIEGTWSRSNLDLTIHPWRRFSPAERAAVEAEAASLPLPGDRSKVRVRWVE
jgi:hypothetical protein